MVDQDLRINTKRFFIFNLPHFIRYIFGGQVLPLLLFFCCTSLLFGVILIFLIVIMMVYKFAFDILADTAKGNMKPNVRQNYLVTNAIAIKVAIIGVLTEGLLLWLKLKGHSESRLILMGVFTFITPAIYMILALTNALLMALNPLKVVKLIVTMPLSYSVFVAFWLLTTVVQEWFIISVLGEHLHQIIFLLISAFFEFGLLFLNFHIMGYIIFQKRKALNLEGIGFERIDEDNLSVQTVVINPFYQRIKRLLSEDDAEQALAMVIDLQKNGDSSSELQELYQLAMQKKLYTPTNIEIGNKVHTYLNQKKDHKAFDLVRAHIDAGKDFIEESPADINRLIHCALEKNRSEYIAHLVKDFHKKYLYHADIVPNYFLLAKALYENVATRNESKAILIGLIEKYPKDKAIAEVKAWLKGLQLMERKKDNDH